MLCWFLLSPQKQKKEPHEHRKGWVLWSGRGQLRETGSTSAALPATSRPPSPYITDPKISAYFDVAIPHLDRALWGRIPDLRTRWAPCRNSTNISAPFFNEPLLLSTPSFFEVGGNIYNTLTLESFKDLCLDSQRIKKLTSKLQLHCVNY